ncbi:MAG TPA: GNVR domain-containing protein, partial [Terriglobia bacterium]|nr:GNVR domain-containing protein [Terriglobia bacterium]
TQVAAHVEESNPLKREFQQSIEQLDVKIAGLDAKINEIRLPVAKIENILKRLNSGEDQLEKANREQRLAEEIYVGSARRLEAARISNELDQDRAVNVAILSPPIKPLEPVSPRRLLMLVLSLPAGALLAIGFVLFMHYAQNTSGEPGITEPGVAASTQSGPAVASGEGNRDSGEKSPEKKGSASAG